MDISAKMSDQIQERLCLVCGEIASGYHYEVLTCESCKSFFRRNALKNAAKFYCVFNGRCNMSGGNRNTCKKCRLNKCLVVGMRTSLIYSDKQIQIRRHIVAENRIIRQTMAKKADSEPNTSTSSDSTRNETIVLSESQNLIENTVTNGESTESSGDSQPNTNTNCGQNSDSTELSVVPIARPITAYKITFNELEGNQLSELFDALKCMEISVFTTDVTDPKDTQEMWSLVMAQNEGAVKLIVQMSKSLHRFNSLCDHDQIILLKYSAIEIDAMRMIMKFNFETQCFANVYHLHIDIIKLMTQFSEDIYLLDKLYLENMGLDWESDPMIIDLCTTVPYHGYHFDAITCESCKSFFRRSALIPDHFRCYLGNACKIDIDNRKHCKKCRLNKCFSVGMKTDLIYSCKHREKSASIVKQPNSRQKRKRKARGAEEETNSGSDSPPEPTASAIDTDVSFNDMLHDNDLEDEVINELLTDAKDLIDDTDLQIETEEPAMSLMPAVFRPITDYNSGFNELEGKVFGELIDGLKCIQIETKGVGEPMYMDIKGALDVFKIDHELRIRDIIAMSKCITGFNGLVESDRLTLIKYSALEIINLRMISCFNFEEGFWDIILNNTTYRVTLELFKREGRLESVGCGTYDYHRSFLQNMGLDWESDPLIIDFLTAILLFNPNRPNLLNKSMVKHQQNIYMHLLSRYLRMKCRSEFLASAKLLRLIDSLKYLNVLNTRIAYHAHTKKLNGLNPRFPLFREICDRSEIDIVANLHQGESPLQAIQSIEMPVPCPLFHRHCPHRELQSLQQIF
ncbi:unnamed protein product [Medioppia subpectinata]|uniref:Nuclear receptor n=1 Tax=Medioppia subpectinata TaxID=1979941 RepID=A0A7R9KC71_9ACAR|nr:unnamed protein product [Medioppia subpectinata]CAG2099961.1 unnamed protein product [Medioppia subpectinata]